MADFVFGNAVYDLTLLDGQAMETHNVVSIVVLAVFIFGFFVFRRRTIERIKAHEDKCARMIAASGIEFPITVTVPKEAPESYPTLYEAELDLEFFDTRDNDGVVVDARGRKVKLRIWALATEIIELEA